MYEPNDRPTYSNVGFSLLGLVLERTSGSSYAEVIQARILDPLGMGNTSTEKPNDSLGIIPNRENDWGTADWHQRRAPV